MKCKLTIPSLLLSLFSFGQCEPCTMDSWITFTGNEIIDNTLHIYYENGYDYCMDPWFYSDFQDPINEYYFNLYTWEFEPGFTPYSEESIIPDVNYPSFSFGSVTGPTGYYSSSDTITINNIDQVFGQVIFCDYAQFWITCSPFPYCAGDAEGCLTTDLDLEYGWSIGCTDPLAFNFSWWAYTDNGGCDYDPGNEIDLNGDSSVNTQDLVAFLSNFGSTSFEGFEPGDFNNDWIINTTDLVMFLSNF